MVTKWYSKTTIFSPLNILYWLLICYLLYHAIFSNKGIITLFEIEEQIREEKTSLNALQNQHLDFKNSITALNNESLSLDMIEEKAKEKFNLVQEREMLLIIEH